MIYSLIFIALLSTSVLFFLKRIKFIKDTIFLGKIGKNYYNEVERWKLVLKVALGQSKMVKRPFAGILHIVVFAGFIIVNIEMLEIILDGIFNTHRLFSFMGGFYRFLINTFELFAVSVILACIIFLIRRRFKKVKRFHSAEMSSWPKRDARYILWFEITLMSAFLIMNSADLALQNLGAEAYHKTGNFIISGYLAQLLSGFPEGILIFIERFAWWLHIVGVLIFLNYVTYSKHLHIFLAFPNVYYSKLEKLAYHPNMESVAKEVELMMTGDPYAEPEEEDHEAVPEKFGVNDICDFDWKTILDAFTCTECGRCTSVCPANLTGKKLSPRKLIMDVRDRSEEVGKKVDKEKELYLPDDKSLFDYISPEELWACTTCNACTESCPVNINHLDVIYSLRRYMVMEESNAPAALNMSFKNIENNGAPWQYSPEDRLLWTEE